MAARPDFVVYSPSNEIQLVVEVKNKRRASDEWAADFRRALIAHAVLPPAKYFLLVLRDRLHLWKDRPGSEEVPADYKASTTDAFRPYLAEWANERLSESGFELLVKAWLGDLMRSDLSQDTSRPELGWLFDSGLYEHIKHGHIEREAVA